MLIARLFARTAIAATAAGAFLSSESAAKSALRRTALTLVANIDIQPRVSAATRNPCQPNPCRHGAACTERNSSGNGRRGGDDDYECACEAGFTGHDCEINVDGCATYTCANDGLCVDSINGPVCMCANGFAGDNCRIYSNPCGTNPCQNGGTCTPAMLTPPVQVEGDKWCVTKEKAMCVHIHWTFPEECSKEACAARCDNAPWACDAFSYWRGRCWLCEPGMGIQAHENLVGTKYYTKAPTSIPGETCIGDSVASDQRYTGKYTCMCPAGTVGENCQKMRE